MTNTYDQLYLFGYSPRTTQLVNLLSILKAQVRKGKNIALIYMHDAVISANNKGIRPSTAGQVEDLSIDIYAMVPDLEARGISIDSLSEATKPLQYPDLVDLLDSTEKIISWL